MEAPKRGRGRPPKISKTASEKQVQEQQHQGAVVEQPATRTGRGQQAAKGAEGGASTADSGAKASKKRGREQSIER